MFALFPEFGARTRPQDLWPFLISETGLKFLIWTQGKIHQVTEPARSTGLIWRGPNALINWNPDPPPLPRAYVGQCGGFLWYLKAWLARGGGGFLRICLAYSWTSGSEVGIWLVPSFLTVISSRDHWYFDVYMLWSYLACWLWKVSFLIVFPFISLLRLILCDFALGFHGSLTGNCYCYSKLLQTMQIHAPLLIIKGAASRLFGSFC